MYPTNMFQYCLVIIVFVVIPISDCHRRYMNDSCRFCDQCNQKSLQIGRGSSTDMHNARLVRVRDPNTCCRAVRAYCKRTDDIAIVDRVSGNITIVPYRHPVLISCGLDAQWHQYGNQMIIWFVYCIEQQQSTTISTVPIETTIASTQITETTSLSTGVETTTTAHTTSMVETTTTTAESTTVTISNTVTGTITTTSNPNVTPSTTETSSSLSPTTSSSSTPTTSSSSTPTTSESSIATESTTTMSLLPCSTEASTTIPYCSIWSPMWCMFLIGCEQSCTWPSTQMSTMPCDQTTVTPAFDESAIKL